MLFYENAILEKWEPQSFSTWEKAWKEFQQTNCIEYRKSILHHAFDYEAHYDSFGGDRGYFERVHCFLAVAEGHTHFRRTNVNGKRKSIRDITAKLYGYMDSKSEGLEEVRGYISRKAFEVLCQKVFKNEEKPHLPPSWKYYIEDEETLLRIFQFFRLDGNGFSNLSTSTIYQDGSSDIAKSFLLNLVLRLWPAREDCNQETEFPVCFKYEDLDVFQRFQPNFIDILHGLDETDRILTRKLTPLGRSRLRRLALSREVWNGRDHIPAESVNQSALHGSNAARTLVLYTQLEIQRHREENQRRIKQRKEKAAAQKERRREQAKDLRQIIESSRIKLKELNAG